MESFFDFFNDFDKYKFSTKICILIFLFLVYLIIKKLLEKKINYKEHINLLKYIMQKYEYKERAGFLNLTVNIFLIILNALFWFSTNFSALFFTNEKVLYIKVLLILFTVICFYACIWLFIKFDDDQKILKE